MSALDPHWEPGKTPIRARDLNTLAEMADVKIVGGDGIRVAELGRIFTISAVRRTSSPGASLPPHPFQVSTRPHPTQENQWQASVHWDSHVMYDDDIGASAPSIGRLSSEGAPFWLDLAPTDYLWLEHTLATSTFQIKCLGEGDTWSDFRDYIEINDSGFGFKLTRRMIATIAPGDTGVPEVTQYLKSNLRLESRGYGGQGGLYPKPDDIQPYAAP